MRYNGNKFSVYESEEKTVLGLLDELGSQVNHNTDSLDSKTDLHGNHLGQWQGLNRPTMSEEGMRATVEDIIDNKIPSIEASLDTMTNTKIDYPILQCEIDKVVNVKYEYGNILRYGAINNLDSTNALQVAFDVCAETGYSVKLPNSGQYVITSSIVLKEGIKYTIEQQDNIFTSSDAKAKFRLKAKCDLFIGEKPSARVGLNMKGVSIVFFKEGLENGYINDLGLFYQIRLLNSLIERCNIECCGYVLKNSGMSEISHITNCNFHNISKNFILYSSDNLFADSYISYSRISGRASELPCLLYGHVDVDTIFTNNFIDYFAYLSDGGSSETEYEIGKWYNNTFNRMFRIFKNAGKGVFIANIFEYFKSSERAFTNLDDLMQNGKWGPFVYDKHNTGRGYSNLQLIDNTVIDCDNFIYYSPNNGSNNAYGNNIQERGTIGKGNESTFIFHPRTSTSKIGYLTSKIESLNYENRTSESVPSKTTIQETYNDTSYNVYDSYLGCHRFYNDGLYVASYDLTWKKLY